MSLFITSLNSGSNGNCYYVGNQDEAILIDAGISCREIEKRMKRLQLSIAKIKAVFISHEHSDHISGLSSLIKKYKFPVYITTSTLIHSNLNIEQANNFFAFEPVIIGNLSITAFPKFHDACDPCSFIVDCNKVRIGVFTDIGFPCKNLINYFKQCHAAFLETNYDENMLERGSYPIFLKRRIRGGQGHLSNKQALELFISYRSSFMSHLFLSHLSKNNNSPELVQGLFNEHADNVKIIVAPRNRETELYRIDNFQNSKVSSSHSLGSLQLSFSFA